MDTLIGALLVGFAGSVLAAIFLEGFRRLLKKIIRPLFPWQSSDETEPLPPGHKQKQIKILAITASPEEENDLLYEKEQDTLLDVFNDFDRDRLFLDMPDPVHDTLSEIRDYLEDGRHDVLLLTAHGGINENNEGVRRTHPIKTRRDAKKRR